MMSVSIEIENADELEAYFKKAPQVAGREIKRALDDASNLVLRTMVSEEPHDTGKLRQSTHIDNIIGGKVIKTGVDYAIVVHQGTGKGGVASVVGKLVGVNWATLSPRGRAKLLSYGIKPGKSGKAYFVRKRETPANPYADRTLAKTEGDVQSFFKTAAQRIIDTV